MFELFSLPSSSGVFYSISFSIFSSRFHLNEVLIFFSCKKRCNVSFVSDGAVHIVNYNSK